MIHNRIPSEHRAVRQMQRAWDTPKIAVCPDSGCACCSLKSQYPQIVMSLLFESGDIFSSPILKKRQKIVRCVVEGFLKISHIFFSDKTGKCVRWLSTTKGDISMDNILTVPIHLKMPLTAREAAEYSNIGINKIDSMLRSPNCPFVLFVGTKKLVKRREFEEYISPKLVIWQQKIICKNSLREKNLSAIIMSLQWALFSLRERSIQRAKT